MITKCICCNNTFNVKPYVIKKGYGKFCSNECFIKMRKFKNKICPNCKIEFEPNSGYQNFCTKICQEIKEKETKKEVDRLYYQTHKIEISEQGKIYRGNNKDKLSEYYQDNKLQYRDWTKKWAKEHPEKRIEYQNKRERNLGFDILWKPDIITEPMEHHHISKELVVLIPKRINRSIYHNVFTGYNMGKINQLAFDYIINNGGGIII